MEALEIEITDCWNRIGVWGHEQARCPKLQEVIHCQNCRIYSDAGRNLLDRPVADEYIDEWTETLGREKQRDLETSASVLAFRLGNEWFGLPTATVCEITEMRTIHSIPHSTSPALKGMINIRGELQLCVSLGNLFGLEKSDMEPDVQRKVHERIIVAELDSARYVFPVSEVSNIFHYHADHLQETPATVGKKASTFITGILRTQDRNVGCLDADLLFHALKRKVS